MISRNIVSSIYRSISRSIVKYASSIFSPASISSVLQYTIDSETPYTGSTLNGISVLSSLEDSDSYRFPLKGRAWLFDGTNDYATHGARVTSGSPTQLTCAAWIKTTATTGRIVGEYDDSISGGTQRGWLIGLSTGSINVTLSGDGLLGSSVKNYITTTTVNTGTWVHIAFTFSPNDLTIYINGSVATVTKITDSTVNSIFNSSSFFGIGARRVNSTPDGYFTGSMYDIRVYNVTKSAAEILTISNQASTPHTIDTAGLVAHYWCNEEAGTTGFDSSGNDNHLTLTNITPATFHAIDQGVVYNPANNVGHTSRMVFNGTNTQVSTNQKFNISGATLTLTAKIRTNSAGGTYPIFDNGDLSGGYMVFMNVSNCLDIIMRQAGSSSIYYRVAGSTLLNDGVEREVVLTVNNTGGTPVITATLNGVTETFTVTTAPTGSYGDNASATGVIGARVSTPIYWTGTIADVSVSNGTQSYSATGYNSTLWGTGTVSGNTQSLIVPQDESTPADSVFGSSLNYTGQAPYPATIESPCATLDGTNDYGTTTATNIIATNMSFGGWVIVSNWAGAYNSVIVTKSLNNQWQLFLEGGNIVLRTGVSPNVTFSHTSLSAGWHHIFGTISGTTGTIYVDGVSVASGTVVAMPADNSSLVNVGRFTSGIYYFPGSFSDIRVFSVAKSAAEVRAIYNGNPDLTSLLCWWPMQEGGGLVSYDMSGNGNHLNWTGITESTFWGTRNGGKTQDVAMLYGGRWAGENRILGSEAMQSSPWLTSSSAGAITVTGDSTTAPDGSSRGCTLAYPAVSGSGMYSVRYIGGVNVSGYSIGSRVTWSIWLKGAVGGEEVWLMEYGVSRSSQKCTLTTEWVRYSFTFTAQASPYIMMGVDLRELTQTATPAQTIYAWGVQFSASNEVLPYVRTYTTSQTSRSYVPGSPLGSYCVDTLDLVGVAGKYSNPYSRLNHDPYDAAEYNPLAIPSYEALPCLTGNGTDNYVDLGSPLIPATADFEMNFWYYHVTNDTTIRSIISQYSTGVSERFSIEANLGPGVATAASLRFYCESGLNIALTSALIEGTWHKITLSRSGSIFTAKCQALGGNLIVGQQTRISAISQANTWIFRLLSGADRYNNGRIAYLTVTTGGITKEVPLTDGSSSNIAIYADSDESIISSAAKGTLTNIWANTTDSRMLSTDNAYRAIVPCNTKFRRTNIDGDDRFVILRSAATGSNLSNLIEYTS